MPDDSRKFTEIYNVQHLQSAQLDRVSHVCISTIQRLYSVLRGEGEIRCAIIKADLVDCMVALPGSLVYSTSIPDCLGFLSRNKRNSRFRDRRL
jgi:hypothetical protein